MSYHIQRGTPEWSAWKNGEMRASVDLHQAPGILYATDLKSDGDPGALRALIRAVTDLAKTENIYLHVDARDPAALRLCRLYSRIGTLEYLSFKVAS